MPNLLTSSYRVLAAVIDLLDLGTGTIRSLDSPRDRMDNLDHFNSDSEQIRIVLANINTMPYGINAHYKCNTGIFVNLHNSPQTNNQMIARLWRLNQSKPVVWHHFKMKGSFHDHLERNICAKWSPILSSEFRTPEGLDIELAEIVIYEAMRTKLNQPFNRYAWVILKVVEKGRSKSGMGAGDLKAKIDLDNDALAIIGHACTLIARECLGTKSARKTWLQDNCAYINNALWSMAFPAQKLAEADVKSKAKDLFDMVCGRKVTDDFWGVLSESLRVVEEEEKKSVQLQEELKRQRAEAAKRSRAAKRQAEADEAAEDNAEEVPDQVFDLDDDDAEPATTATAAPKSRSTKRAKRTRQDDDDDTSGAPDARKRPKIRLNTATQQKNPQDKAASAPESDAQVELPSRPAKAGGKATRDSAKKGSGSKAPKRGKGKVAPAQPPPQRRSTRHKQKLSAEIVLPDSEDEDEDMGDNGGEEGSA
jgi:hypothetical protein